MRVSVIGSCDAAVALRSKVYNDAALALVERGPVDVTIEINDEYLDVRLPTVDGAFSARARLLPIVIEQIADVCGGVTVLGAHGLVVDDARVLVRAPALCAGDVSTALYRALLLLARPTPQPQPTRRLWRRLVKG